MQEREAINEVLLNINELPLDDSDVVEDINIAVVVSKVLDISRKQILGQGWNFNRTTRDLVPNIDEYIIIPKSFLAVDGASDTDNYTVRDSKLFDKTNISFRFTSPVSCEIIEDIVFDDIPYVFANYIVKSASLMTYSNIVGDVNGVQIRATQLNEAKIDAIRTDANEMDGNLLTSTYITDLSDKTSI
jgi:hypothetical protein